MSFPGHVVNDANLSAAPLAHGNPPHRFSVSSKTQAQLIGTNPYGMEHLTNNKDKVTGKLFLLAYIYKH